MLDNATYTEKVSSRRTQLLFVVLALLFLALGAWRVAATGFNVLAIVLLFLFAIFAFYAVNYQTLIIQLSPELLVLKFGLFKWTTPVENIETCALDDVSLWRIGGAGIHFTPIRGRYRAMFNFLEHARVVVMLKKKKGLVRDIAFSTQHPEKVKQLIQASVAAKTPRSFVSGDWTLNIFFRNQGSRSEGQHGVLLHKGETVEGSETGAVIDTDLGQLKYYGAEGSIMLWQNTGWNFADEDRILPSWEEPPAASA